MAASVKVRGGASGPVLTGTPGNALIIDADGQSVTSTPIGPGAGVVSWNGRTNIVVPVANDYKASQVQNDSTVAGAEVSDALDTLKGQLFQVAGTPQIGFVVGWDGTQPVWEAVPVAFAINSFAKVGSTLVLAGATVATPSFTASYNQAATAVTLTDTLGHSDPIALPGTAFVSPHSFTLATYGASVTFTDTASSALGSAARSVTLSAGNNVYTGAIADPGGGGYTNAFITALGATLKQAPSGTYAYNATAGQSCFFAARSAFGLTVANFTVGGFPFACSLVAAAVAVTNANGVTENYDLFRSDNTGLGAFNLVEA